MRILSYNVLGFQGWPERMMPSAVDRRDQAPPTSVFRSTSCGASTASIICLQEVDTVERMKRHLANALGRYLAPFPSPTPAMPAACCRPLPIVETRLFNKCGPAENRPIFRRFGGAALLEIGLRSGYGVVNLHLNPHDIEMRCKRQEICWHGTWIRC